jgi:hypothetical protein
MLDRYDLTYVIDDEVLKITSRAAAERLISTRAFDLSGMIQTGGSAEEVGKVVANMLDNVSKPSKDEPKVNSPDGLHIVPFRDRLIVRGSALDQRRVEEILQLLSRDNLFLKREKERRSLVKLNPAVESPPESTFTRIFVLKHANASEIASQLQQLHLPGRGDTEARIAADEQHDRIIVIGDYPQMKAALQYVTEHDKAQAELNEDAKTRDESETSSVSPLKGEPPRPTITLDEVMFVNGLNGVNGQYTVEVQGRVTKAPAGSEVTIGIYALDHAENVAILDKGLFKITETGAFRYGWKGYLPAGRLLVKASIDKMGQITAEREVEIEESASATSAASISPELFTPPVPASNIVADFDAPSVISVAAGSRFVVRGTLPANDATEKLENAPPRYDLRLYPNGESPRNTPGKQATLLLLPYGDRWWFETSVIADIPPGEYEMRYGPVLNGGVLEGEPIFVTVTESKSTEAASDAGAL